MKQKKQYEWKAVGISNRGVPANKIVQEFQKVEKTFGSLTPETLLSSATPESSILHPLFTWDNIKAAHQYRLQQARSIINNVEVVTLLDGQERRIPVYEVIKLKGNGQVYKHIDTFSYDDIEQVRERTTRDLNSIRSKLLVYKAFHPVVEKLDATITELENS